MPEKHLYQKMLSDEFERRKLRNVSYSLRAYARDLEIPAPKLSEYLSGKCGLSRKKAAELASRIRLNAIETEVFICSSEAAHARDKLGREAAGRRLKVLLSGPARQIDDETFRAMRNWYHVAILELIETEGFQADLKWIAGKLGIQFEQAEDAIRNLEALNLIIRQREGWKQTGTDFQTAPDVASVAIREYHRQMLQLTIDRFEAVAIEERELSSMVFAMDCALLPELKNLLRRQHKEVAALLASGKKLDSVYALNHQLLPLTTKSGVNE
jgi:uncharacterized protein (TIGR02147 family)